VSNHIEAAAEAIEEHIGGWQPENAVDLDAFLSALPRLFESVAGSVRTVAERLGDEFPVHPSVVDHLREISATVAGMTDFSAEAHSTHRQAHAHELERIEEPRPGESMWDVERNS
jgi:hypothetical protein